MRSLNMPHSTSAGTVPSGVDGVEIKVTLDEGWVDNGLAAFHLDLAVAERRRIWFCEYRRGSGGPAALPLLARGLILRVRSRSGHADDSTLKLRGPEGCVDPEAWRRRAQAFTGRSRIEGDWAGRRRLVSASLDNDIDGDRIEEVLAEQPPPVLRLFSKEQESLAHDCLFSLDNLDLLGPIRAWKWDQPGMALEPQIAAELWEVDDTLRFLELSIRVEENPVSAQKELEDIVRNLGLEIASEQETKTRIVLERLASARSPLEVDKERV